MFILLSDIRDASPAIRILLAFATYFVGRTGVVPIEQGHHLPFAGASFGANCRADLSQPVRATLWQSRVAVAFSEPNRLAKFCDVKCIDPVGVAAIIRANSGNIGLSDGVTRIYLVLSGTNSIWPSVTCL